MLGKDIGILQVLRRSTVGSYSVLWERVGEVKDAEWNRMILRLDPGIYQLIIIGIPREGPRGDIAIDDLAIGNCVSFGKFQQLR